jgi:hypothetical protein
MKACVLVFALVVAGCAARVQVNSGASPAPGGGSIVSGQSGVHVQAGSNSFAAAILAISILAGALHESGQERPFPSPSALMPDAAPRAPELAPGRRVNEQDCTKPIEDWSGNLRCR